MLEITVNDDRSVTISSDDAFAENIAVGEAFDDAGATDAAALWSDAKVDDEGLLSITVPKESALAALLALEESEDEALSYWSEEIDSAIATLRPHVGGGPKKL